MTSRFSGRRRWGRGYAIEYNLRCTLGYDISSSSWIESWRLSISDNRGLCAGTTHVANAELMNKNSGIPAHPSPRLPALQWQPLRHLRSSELAAEPAHLSAPETTSRRPWSAVRFLERALRAAVTASWEYITGGSVAMGKEDGTVAACEPSCVARLVGYVIYFRLHKYLTGAFSRLAATVNARSCLVTLITSLLSFASILDLLDGWTLWAKS